MLIQFGSELAQYFREVFVDKCYFWLLFGVLAQLLSAARFLVQWISGERPGKSVIPFAFWIHSIGALMTLIYGMGKCEPVIIFGQGFAASVYVRNLVLILRERRSTRRPADPSPPVKGGHRPVRIERSTGMINPSDWACQSSGTMAPSKRLAAGKVATHWPRRGRAAHRLVNDLSAKRWAEEEFAGVGKPSFDQADAGRRLRLTKAIVLAAPQPIAADCGRC